jgi:hypothetical protein
MSGAGIHEKGRAQLKNTAKPHKRNGTGKGGQAGGKVDMAPKGIPNGNGKTLLQDRKIHDQEFSITNSLLPFQGVIATIKI